MRVKYRLRSYAFSLSSFETLSTHRFASHVCQTMFTVAKDMVSREVCPIMLGPSELLTAFHFLKTQGILPVVQKSSEHGELRTVTDLIMDVCKVPVPSHRL